MDSNATSLQAGGGVGGGAGGGVGGGWLHALTLTHTQLSTSGQYRYTGYSQHSTIQYRTSFTKMLPTASFNFYPNFAPFYLDCVHSPAKVCCCRCQITEASAPFHTEQQDRNLSVISK